MKNSKNIPSVILLLKKMIKKNGLVKKILLLTILLQSVTILSAQDKKDLINTRPKNNISLNFLGDASSISINYEKQFFLTPGFVLSSKVGFGYLEDFRWLCFGDCSTPTRWLTIPHHITGNFGKGRHFFEMGLGGTIINGNDKVPYSFYTTFGYRILPLRSKNVNFRIFAQIPIVGLEPLDTVSSPIGFNLGISF